MAGIKLIGVSGSSSSGSSRLSGHAGRITPDTIERSISHYTAPPKPLVGPTVKKQAAPPAPPKPPKKSVANKVASFLTPVKDVAVGTAKSAYHVATAIPQEADIIKREHGAKPALNISTKEEKKNTKQAAKDATDFARFAPRAAVQVGESVNPKGHPSSRNLQVTDKAPGVLKVVLGKDPIPSIENVYKTTQKQYGTSRAAGTALVTAVGDALALKGGHDVIKHTEDSAVAAAGKDKAVNNLITNSKVQKATEPFREPDVPAPAKTPKVILKPADKLAAKEPVAVPNLDRNGVMSAVDRTVSKAGKAAVYKAADLLGYSNPVGRKIIAGKDKFMSHWVTALHPVYKAAKRSDFEGTTKNAYQTLRATFGDSNRALSDAQSYLENNKNIKNLTDSLHARGPDPIKTRKAFDEYAAARSDADLLTAGKKEGFSPEKVAKINSTLGKHSKQGFDKEYQSLVKSYSDLNELLHKEGIRSTEVYKSFKDDPFDYVRQQREIPDWMKEQPGAGGRKGSVASITESRMAQRRNKFASGEVLSPYETLIKSVQNAHVEIARNRAAKTLYKTLDQAGEAKLVRSTDVVREKQALLGKLQETKPIVAKQGRIVRTYKKQVTQLQRELDKLNQQGLDASLTAREGEKTRTTPGAYLNKEDVTSLKRTSRNKPTMSSVGTPGKIQGKLQTRLTTARQLNSSETRQLVHDLIVEDPAKLQKIRNMIESRNTKLEPLLDSLQTANRDLAEVHAHRTQVWNAANSLKSTVDKKGMTSLSFLDDGVENVVKVDPSIASAVHNWDAQAQNVVLEYMRGFNQMFKYGTTGLNAGFALPNFVADQAEALINSPAAFATHNPYIFTKTLFQNLGVPITKTDEKILAAYMEENGKSLAVNMYTKPSKTARVANDLALGKREPQALTTTIKHPVPAFLKGVDRLKKKTYTYIKPSHGKDSAHALFNMLEDTIGLTEQQTRLQVYSGLYRKAIRQGKTEQEARSIAKLHSREASIDFLEMGSYGKVVNSFIPYFNATLQGGRTVGRNFAERPVSVAAKTAAVVGMPVAATTIWNTTNSKRRAIYNTIPDYVKETNFVVVSPGASWDADKKKWNGVYIVKKPQGYKQFAEPLRKFIEYKANNGDGANLAKFLKQQGASSAAQVAGSVSPISTGSVSQAIGSVIPQAGKGAVEDVANHNFFENRQIVSDKLKSLPPDQQKGPKSSKTSETIGRKFGISPMMVDNLIKETFGETGTNAQNTADRLTTNNPKEIGGRSLPDSVSRRFVGVAGGADADAFYKNYTPLKAKRDQLSKQITQLVQDGKSGTAQRLLTEYNNGLSTKFSKFHNVYGNSPTYDRDPKTGWDVKISKLKINPGRANPTRLKYR